MVSWSAYRWGASGATVAREAGASTRPGACWSTGGGAVGSLSSVGGGGGMACTRSGSFGRGKRRASSCSSSALLCGGRRQQLVGVLGRQVGRQHHHPAQVQPALGQRREKRGEPPRRPRCMDAFERRLFGQAQLVDAVEVHRGKARRQVARVIARWREPWRGGGGWPAPGRQAKTLSTLWRATRPRVSAAWHTGRASSSD